MSNQDELICAYPYAGRDLPGTEDIYGTFVAMPFLRQKIDPDQTFKELVGAVHHQMLEDKEHLSAAPYDAEIPGMDSLNAIFSLQLGIDLEGRFAGSSYKIQELPSNTSKGDVTAILYQSKDGSVEGRIEFDSSVFEKDMLDGFVDNFVTLVTSVASRTDLRIGEITYQTDAQMKRFIELSGGKEFELPDVTIVQRFSEIVQKCPSSCNRI